MRSLHLYHNLIEPRSTSSDHRRREFILNVLLASSTILSVAATIIVAVEMVNQGAQYSGEPPLFAVLQVALFAGLWLLSRKGFFTPAAYVLIIILFLLACYTLFMWGILLPQGILLLALIIVMSSILLGTSIAAAVTMAASAALIVLGYLQQTGLAVFDSSWMKTPGGLSDAVGFSLTLAVITTVSWLSNREIERFNITLQQRIHQATERLSSANRNLKSLDKTKDDFISMASHQLGTPLTAISGYLSMALDEDKHNLSPAQHEYLTYALEASNTMVSMASDLLNVSRLNSGRFMIQRQSTDLSQLVAKEVHQLRAGAERKNLKLVYDPPAEFPHIYIDESKTRQVIMNFIDNAIYYTPAGEILIELKRTGDLLSFTVTDHGIGVPQAEQAKLFSKFYRAENAKETRPDGTGLGLYLAKEVIQAQAGKIIFSSHEGKGSTFGFSFSYAAASQPPKPAAVPAASAPTPASIPASR